MSTPPRLLAIDPGYDRLGVAILDGIRSKEQLVFSTTIITNKAHTHIERLRHIEEELAKIVSYFEPKIASIEKIFFANNAKTVIPVAESRGVCLVTLAKHNVVVYEYSPPEIKVAVTGYGRSSKQDVEFMVRKLISVPTDRKILDDEIDAIAIGLTHNAIHKSYM